MKMQILVPQWHETDDIIRPLLDSIRLQQGISFDDIGVIITNDGSDVFLTDDFLKSYPFEIIYNKAEHHGVSATRNACLDAATADFVMFCDADDLFYNVCGLYIVFREINNDGFDMLVSEFLEETRDAEKQPVFVKHERDSTFVHGKVFRRQFLVDNDIRFKDELTIHEDSYFNNLAQTLADTAKYCQVPFYLWKWRDDSICRHDPKYILKTYNNMLDSSSALANEYIKRGEILQAQSVATGMIYNAYYCMNKDEWKNQENVEYRKATERRFKEYYLTFKEYFEQIPDRIKKQIIVAVKNQMFREGLFMETITFDDWIAHVLEAY